MVEAMEIQKGFKQTEVGVIPGDWKVNLLGNIGGFKKGKNIPKSMLQSNGVPCVLYGEIYTKYNSQCSRLTSRISIETAKNATEIKYGDILFAGSGETAEDIGKCFTYSGSEEAYAGGDVIVFTPKDSDPIFLGFLLNSANANKQKAFMGQGSSVFHIYSSNLKNLNIPLPTKAEQTAIATALNDADALITQLEILIAKKRAIKQGAMQELLKPKDGWEVKNLGQIADIRRGASPRPIKDPKWFSDSGRGWIRISDVTSSNVYLNSTTQYLSEDGARNSVAVNRGDLIMSICATIGIPIIINIPACIHDGFVLFQNYEKELDTFFLYFCLQVKTEILTGKGQPGTQKNLNTTIVGDIEIDYPDVDEQRKIGLILRNIDIEISGLENKLNKYKMIKQGMMQNLLTGRIRLV